jgi:hypothetical protein
MGGHNDIVARKRDRGGIRGMRALLFDGPVSTAGEWRMIALQMQPRAKETR